MSTPTGTQTIEQRPGFERQTCGRCGGSGQYSWCARYGTRCFGCGGSGETLTKRGLAASRYYQSMLEVPADSLTVGDLIRCEMMTLDGSASAKYFAPITDIKESAVTFMVDGVSAPGVRLELTTTHNRHGRHTLVVSSQTMVRKAQSNEFKQAKLQDALAYQATLTQAGTVRKRRKVAA